MPNEPTARLIHHGKGGELFLVFLVNLFLKVITLGIYHFWAKTRVRRYLWSQASFDGERFEYTGRGLELFLGFLQAIAVLGFTFVSAYVVSYLLAEAESMLAFVPLVAVWVAMIVLVGVAIYSARRYLLSRTRWRGIRFAQTGSALTYAGKWIGHSLLMVPTMGLYAPFMKNALTSYTFNNTYFGDQQLVYDGRGSDLFGKFLLAYLLTLPTLGLIWFWYKAVETRYVAAHSRIQNVSFASELTGLRLFGLVIVNLLLLIVTLGLAYPWVLLRTARFVFGNLQVQGDFDYSAISQSLQTVPRTGEGLAEAFGTGGI